MEAEGEDKWGVEILLITSPLVGHEAAPGCHLIPPKPRFVGS